MSQINVTEYKTLIQNANVEVKVVWCLAEWQTHQGPHQKLEVWLQRSFRPLVVSLQDCKSVLHGLKSVVEYANCCMR